MWGAPAEPADSYYEVRPECTDVPKTRFKIKVCAFLLVYAEVSIFCSFPYIFWVAAVVVL